MKSQTFKFTNGPVRTILILPKGDWVVHDAILSLSQCTHPRPFLLPLLLVAAFQEEQTLDFKGRKRVGETQQARQILLMQERLGSFHLQHSGYAYAKGSRALSAF